MPWLLSVELLQLLTVIQRYKGWFGTFILVYCWAQGSSTHHINLDSPQCTQMLLSSSSVTHFVATQMQGYIHVCDSLVMRHNSFVLAGIRHVTETPPGRGHEDEASAADVRWLVHVHEGDKALFSLSIFCLSQRRCYVHMQ